MKKKYKIAVIGMGQGGMVAAYYLAKGGHKVTIFEKQKKEDVSYPWTDDMVVGTYKAVGLPLPPKELYTQMNTWDWVSPDGTVKTHFPPNPEGYDMSIRRHELSLWLADLCTKEGAKIRYASPVQELLLQEDKVIGVRTADGRFPADLVIDASGLTSPFRGQVPAKFGIQAQSAPDDNMTAYRAFFKMKEGTPIPTYPDARSCMYLKHMGGVGISWCNISPENNVDILIGRIGGLSKEETETMLADLKQKHPMVTDEVVVPGRWIPIGTRYTLSRLVADGYAAVGDSAYMTIPIMGSGIEASMKAGKILADVVNTNGLYKKELTAENLWLYQTRYFHKTAWIFSAIDVLKRWVLNVDDDLINWLFTKVAPTPLVEAITDLITKRINGMGCLRIVLRHLPGSLFQLLTHFSFLRDLASHLKEAGKAALVTYQIPSKYNPEQLAAWQASYEACFRHQS